MSIPVVLVQSPFLKCAGSHNDSLGIDLAYASRFLEDAGVDHVVVNADYLGSTKYVPWSLLFQNEEMYKAAVDGRSPLLIQAVEQVMQYSPKTVVIAAGDTCIPTKDIGSPYIAAVLSIMLRKYGVRTIGIGPMFMKDPEAFAWAFDELFLALINRSLVDVILGEHPDVITGSPIGALPLFDHTQPHCTTPMIVSSCGCPFACSFCMAPLMTGSQVQFQPLSIVLQDVISRATMVGPKRLYFSDMIFPLNVRRLKLLGEMLAGSGYEFSCESRTDSIRPETIEAIQAIGVKTVKLGLESTDNETLIAMNKKQTLNREEEAIGLLRAAGMKIVGYLILGDFYPSVKAMESSLERAAALDVDHFVVNISSYQSFGWSDDRKYDSHFSMTAARRQGVPDHIVEKALRLQEHRVNPTVDLLT